MCAWKIFAAERLTVSPRIPLCRKQAPPYPRPMSALQAASNAAANKFSSWSIATPNRIFSKAGFYQKMMAFSMRDEKFKVQMFRFVDVLASLRRSGDIVEHLREYFAGMDNSFVPMMKTGLQGRRHFSLAHRLHSAAQRLRDGAAIHRRPRRQGRDENLARETQGAHRVHRRLVRRSGRERKGSGRIRGARDGVARYPLARDRGWTDPLGKNSELFPVVNLSVKISAFYSQMNPAEPGGSGRASRAEAPADPAPGEGSRRLREFRHGELRAQERDAPTLQELFTEEEFANWPHAGIVIQAYLRDSERDLRALIDWGRQRGTRFAVRLVKGAYWDYEKIVAQQNGWVCPVFLQKPESDANFEACTRVLLDNESVVTAAFGSHNVRSIAHAMAYADELGIDQSRFEFQLLYGMAGPIKRALVEMGYRVREYSPVGELLPGMSYLVRRLLENTSNEGFLRAKFSDKLSRPRSSCAIRTI